VFLRRSFSIRSFCISAAISISFTDCSAVAALAEFSCACSAANPPPGGSGGGGLAMDGSSGRYTFPPSTSTCQGVRGVVRGQPRRTHAHARTFNEAQTSKVCTCGSDITAVWGAYSFMLSVFNFCTVASRHIFQVGNDYERCSKHCRDTQTHDCAHIQFESTDPDALPSPQRLHHAVGSTMWCCQCTDTMGS
jgi:hypothetical protein